VGLDCGDCWREHCSSCNSYGRLCNISSFFTTLFCPRARLSCQLWSRFCCTFPLSYATSCFPLHACDTSRLFEVVPFLSLSTSMIALLHCSSLLDVAVLSVVRERHAHVGAVGYCFGGPLALQLAKDKLSDDLQHLNEHKIQVLKGDLCWHAADQPSTVALTHSCRLVEAACSTHGMVRVPEDINALDGSVPVLFVCAAHDWAFNDVEVSNHCVLHGSASKLTVAPPARQGRATH
jgi:hypothetical protein